MNPELQRPVLNSVCLMANFGPLSRGQPYPSDVNHLRVQFDSNVYGSLATKLGP